MHGLDGRLSLMIEQSTIGRSRTSLSTGSLRRTSVELMQNPSLFALDIDRSLFLLNTTPVRLACLPRPVSMPGVSDLERPMRLNLLAHSCQSRRYFANKADLFPLQGEQYPRRSCLSHCIQNAPAGEACPMRSESKVVVWQESLRDTIAGHPVFIINFITS